MESELSACLREKPGIAEARGLEQRQQAQLETPLPKGRRTAPEKRGLRTVGAALDGSHARCRPVTAPPVTPPTVMAASVFSNRPYFGGGCASDMLGKLGALCRADDARERAETCAR